MKFALIILVLSFNAQAGLFSNKAERLAKKFFDRKLDVETEIVMPDKNDECVASQLKTWIREFKKMDDAQREDVRSFFSHLKLVQFGYSFPVGTSKTDITNLRYERCYYNSYPGMGYGANFPYRDCDVMEKQINKNLVATEGHEPSTRPVIVGMRLYYDVQYFSEKMNVTTMTTHSQKVYKEVTAVDSEIYRLYVKEKRIVPAGNQLVETRRCDLKKLTDIINMH